MDKEKIIAQLNGVLENKIATLNNTVRAAICLLAVAAPIGAFAFLFYMPKLDVMKRLEADKVAVQNEVAQVHAAAANLEQHKKEMVKTQDLLEKASVLLPQKKDIPKLLTDISDLGAQAGLDFNSFAPLPERPQNFYNEVPVSVAIKGPYHNIGYFLYQVSKLDRIVSALEINLSSPAIENGEMVLSSSFELITYRFVEAAPDEQK